MTALERHDAILKAAHGARRLGRRMPTQSEIGRALGVSSQTANKDVRRLVAWGLLNLNRPVARRPAMVVDVVLLGAG